MVDEYGQIRTDECKEVRTKLENHRTIFVEEPGQRI